MNMKSINSDRLPEQRGVSDLKKNDIKPIVKDDAMTIKDQP